MNLIAQTKNLDPFTLAALTTDRSFTGTEDDQTHISERPATNIANRGYLAITEQNKRLFGLSDLKMSVGGEMDDVMGVEFTCESGFGEVAID